MTKSNKITDNHEKHRLLAETAILGLALFAGIVLVSHAFGNSYSENMLKAR